MKQVRNTQLEFGKIRIENIELNLKPREDIPVIREFSGEHYLESMREGLLEEIREGRRIQI